MLTAFTAGLLLVTVSELGDKTFFIAMILAMRHSRRLVFGGVITALATMTILSVLLGQTVALLPPHYVKYASILLFLGFGLKLLYEARHMPHQCSVEEEQEAAKVVEQAETQLKQKSVLAIASQVFLLTFVAEWGDRTQFTTIFLAASHHPVGVAVGATLGHAICAAIAVICGRLICKRISERTLTQIGGVLFLLFAAVSLVEALS